MVPTGFRFNPTDEELIDMLSQKVSGNTVMAPPLDFIVERNIYELEPQDLQWTQSVGLNKNERYYYCKRESDSREVTGRGWWKATSHVKTISANGRVVGYKRPLTFHRFRDDQSKRKDAIKTDWIMHEYSLHSIPTEWRLCKIKYKGKEGLKEDMMDGISNNVRPPSMSSDVGSSSSSISPMQLEHSAVEQQQQTLLPPLPLNNDYENYFFPSSNIMRAFDDPQQRSSSFDLPSSSMPILTPSYHHFVQQDNQSDATDQPFPELWSCLHQSLNPFLPKPFLLSLSIENSRLFLLLHVGTNRDAKKLMAGTNDWCFGRSSKMTKMVSKVRLSRMKCRVAISGLAKMKQGTRDRARLARNRAAAKLMTR